MNRALQFANKLEIPTIKILLAVGLPGLPGVPGPNLGPPVLPGSPDSVILLPGACSGCWEPATSGEPAGGWTGDD